MAQNTKIEWADDTYNHWIGCTKVGPGCDNCYAESFVKTHQTMLNGLQWGSGQHYMTKTTIGQVRAAQRNSGQFYRDHGRRKRIFTFSLADVYDKNASDEMRRSFFKLVAETPDVEYLVLTKRIGTAARLNEQAMGTPKFPPNVALGATLVDQDEWDRDLDRLERMKEETGALYSFASIEPMTGPIRMRGRHPDWVIVGGESTPAETGDKAARRMYGDWVRSIRDQCAEAGTPFMFKQWGSYDEAGKFYGLSKEAGRTIDGRTHDDIMETRGPGYAAAMAMVTTPVPPQPQPATIIVQASPAPQPVAMEDRDAQAYRVLTEIAGLLAQLAERFAPQAVLEGDGPEDDDPTPEPPQPPKGKGDADRESKRSDAARKAHATRKANGWVHPSKRKGEGGLASPPGDKSERLWAFEPAGGRL